MLPLPINPSAPALLTALASFHPLAQTIPAWMMGMLMLNNFVIELVHCRLSIVEAMDKYKKKMNSTTMDY
jgi:hypothetical protein